MILMVMSLSWVNYVLVCVKICFSKCFGSKYL